MLAWKWLLFSWSYWNLCILLNYFHCGSNYLKGKKICVVWASDVSPWKHKPGHGTVGSHLMATRTSGDYPDSCLTGENTNYQTIPATDTHSDTTWEAVSPADMGQCNVWWYLSSEQYFVELSTLSILRRPQHPLFLNIMFSRLLKCTSIRHPATTTS